MAENKDADGFAKNIKQSLSLFKPRTGRGSLPHNWVAIEESIILALASDKLKRNIDLSQKQNALIMTKSSIGI